MEDELDRLFELPLAEFTAARNQLAKTLKAAGDTAAADEIRALAKPSAPAWAVNQLTRVERRAVGDLLDAGEALRREQERVLRKGGTTDSLREAAARQRDAIDRLTRRAQAVFDETGRPATAPMIERIARTLQAASVDEDGRRLLEAGRLTEELEPVGFGAFGAFHVPARPPAPSARDELAEKRRQREEGRQRRKELRQKMQQLERAAREAERAAGRAESEAAEARRLADNLRAEADAAAAELSSP